LNLPWLLPNTPFPPAGEALDDPPGLLAAGGDLSIARLELAYRNGIFPWYSEGEPILWWSPQPRMVLNCADFSPSHSLRKRLRQAAADSRIRVKVDTAFASVMTCCAAPRQGPGQGGTWITLPMQLAYRAWHAAGRAHSVETWIDGELAGGLYGVSLGRMFFGESMFTRAPDAS
jgi:leucyl/phenylalanyl-tRNA--protein transferase